MLRLLVVLTLFSAGLGVDLPWSWDTVQLWADFGISNKSLLSPYQSEFVGDHYNIISLAKCLGDAPSTGIPTEQSFYTVAKSIRTYSSNTNVKILFYFSIDTAYCDCYNCTTEVYNNKSMWYYDDYGNPIYAGGDTKRPGIDQTQEYVRNWWINAVAGVLQTGLDMGIEVNGIFADGLCKNWGSNVSESRNNEYIAAEHQLMEEASAALKAINSDMFIIGNGLLSYPYPSDNCMSAVPYVDGVTIAHFGSFEEVDSNGHINPDDLMLWVNLTNSVVSQNKAVFVQARVGPETSPINSMGPSYPSGYIYPTPTTHLQIQNYSTLLISFPLSVYLCGLVSENVYINYGWWWDITQGYCPCPDSPESCGCPLNWYEEFENKLGKPLSDGVFNGYQCDRQFEYANVSVNLDNDSSGIINLLSPFCFIPFFKKIHSNLF